MGKKKRRIAFAVSDYDVLGVNEDGEHQICVRASSGTVLIKTSGEDIYIGPRRGMGTFKISFHGERLGRPEAWQLGQTSEHRASGKEPVWVGKSRLTHTWSPTPFVDGVRTALIWDTYRGAMCAPSYDDDAIQLKYPESNGYVRLIVSVTEAGLTVAECGRQVTHDPLPLASGRKVWLSWQAVNADAPEEVNPADAAIMIPSVLDVNGVEVPHIKVRAGRTDPRAFRDYRPSCPWPAPEPIHLTTDA